MEAFLKMLLQAANLEGSSPLCRELVQRLRSILRRPTHIHTVNRSAGLLAPVDYAHVSVLAGLRQNGLGQTEMADSSCASSLPGGEFHTVPLQREQSAVLERWMVLLYTKSAHAYFPCWSFAETRDLLYCMEKKKKTLMFQNK